jgi:hypothetical protein
MCDQYFVASQPDRSSFFNEVPVTNDCIPNANKLAAFLFFLILFFFLFLGTGALLIRELVNGGWKESKNLRYKIYLLVLGMFFGEIITASLYMGGVQHIIRYPFYAISQIILQVAISSVITAFFTTSSSQLGHNDERSKRNFSIAIR